MLEQFLMKYGWAGKGYSVLICHPVPFLLWLLYHYLLILSILFLIFYDFYIFIYPVIILSSFPSCYLSLSLNSFYLDLFTSPLPVSFSSLNPPPLLVLPSFCNSTQIQYLPSLLNSSPTFPSSSSSNSSYSVPHVLKSYTCPLLIMFKSHTFSFILNSYHQPSSPFLVPLLQPCLSVCLLWN